MKTIALFDDAGWAEDERFPHIDWQEEVAQGATRQGYAQWLSGQYDQEGTQVTFVPENALDDIPSLAATPEQMEGFPVGDWESEVADLATRLGYESWLTHQMEAASED